MKDKEKDKDKKKSEDTPTKKDNGSSCPQPTTYTPIRSNVPTSSPLVNQLNTATRVKDALMGAISDFNVVTEFEKTPFRCVALRANYSWTGTFLFLMFFYSASTYFGEEPIRCIDRYDRSKAPDEALSICIQFPFTRINSPDEMYTSFRDENNKTFAMHYMWTHWMFLVLALLYKITQVACFVMENNVLMEFINSLKATSNYNTRYSLTKAYFEEHYGNHRGMFSRVMLLHLIALLVNTCAFFTINFFLNFKYMKLPLNLLVTRDYEYFDDSMSMLFPPFVECEISPIMHIQEGRTVFYGCHLPLMEIYEKFFMMFWFWQVGMALFTVGSMLLWMYCALRKEAFLNAEELRHFEETTKSLKGLPINEVIVLNMVKPYLFGVNFRNFVFALAKWNPAEGSFVSPHSSYEIYKPDIRQNMSLLLDDDDDTLPALMDNICQMAVDVGDQRGWRLNVTENRSHTQTSKPKPSAPPQKNVEKKEKDDVDS